MSNSWVLELEGQLGVDEVSTHSHPRPQPGLAGLKKPTPNRKPDPNTNAAQQ